MAIHELVFDFLIACVFHLFFLSFLFLRFFDLLIFVSIS